MKELAVIPRVGELEITRRMSLVAVCCSSDSVSWALRASSSLNRRTFSMAMTAWSAKVCRSAIWRSEKPPDSWRETAMAPMAWPSRRRGTPMVLRRPASRAMAHVNSDAWRSGTWTTARSRMTAPAGKLRSGGRGNRLWCRSTPPGCKLWWAATCIWSPSYRNTIPPRPPQSMTAWRAMASNTGWTSAGDREMTPRISAVAVCCSRASASSARSVAFSAASWAVVGFRVASPRVLVGFRGVIGSHQLAPAPSRVPSALPLPPVRAAGW
jgi:hypothetical protein